MGELGARVSGPHHRVCSARVFFFFFFCSGLLLPQFAQVERTDLGNLGAGIYFASNACASAAYSHPSARGHRYMLACTVALGKAYEVRPAAATATSLALDSEHADGGAR